MFFLQDQKERKKKSSFILPGHSSAIGFVGADFLSSTWWRSLAPYRASLSKKPIHCATKKKKKAKFQTQFFIFHLKPSLFKHVSIHMDIFKIQWDNVLGHLVQTMLLPKKVGPDDP